MISLKSTVAAVASAVLSSVLIGNPVAAAPRETSVVQRVTQRYVSGSLQITENITHTFAPSAPNGMSTVTVRIASRATLVNDPDEVIFVRRVTEFCRSDGINTCQHYTRIDRQISRDDGITCHILRKWIYNPVKQHVIQDVDVRCN
jgi:hypothetical protein